MPKLASGQEVHVVAILSTGRVVPAISAAIGYLFRRYHEIAPEIRVIAYCHGFRGLLMGEALEVGAKELEAVKLLIEKGGSPIGGSRVRLSNLSHLQKEGLISPGEDPIEKCAAVLQRDKVDVLHVLGSASAQQTSLQIAEFMLRKLKHRLTLVGIPKTIENDISPIRLTIGAVSAASGGANYFQNVVYEHNANPRMLIIHEIKGRAAGWLTAVTALAYRSQLQHQRFASTLGLARENFDVHAVYTPEMDIDFDSEIGRLKRLMDRYDNVNIFVAQGAFAREIAADRRQKGVKDSDLPRHPQLGYVLTDPSQWLASRIKNEIKAEKVLIQKSGIFVRAGTAARQDLVLAQSTANAAVHYALMRRDGVIGHDEERGGRLRPIEHHRIVSGKPFRLSAPWFADLLAQIGQPQNVGVEKIPFVAKL